MCDIFFRIKRSIPWVASLLREINAYKRSVALLFATVCISSCTTRISTPPQNLDKIVKDSWPLSQKPGGNSACRYSTEIGIHSLKSGQYDQASTAFNTSVRLDPQNSYLHYLNALTYHMWGLSQDPSQLPKAEIGYETALKFDPGNALAAYNLGQFHMDTHQFSKAQNQFSNGLLSSPFNPKFLLGLAVASYMNQDVETALQSIQILEKLNAATPGLSTPEMYRAAAFIYASANEPMKAQEYLEKYKKTYVGPDAQNFIATLENRLKSWEQFYLSFSEDLENLGINDEGMPVTPPPITEKKLSPPEHSASPTHPEALHPALESSKPSHSDTAPSSHHKEHSEHNQAQEPPNKAPEESSTDDAGEYASEKSRKMIVLDVMILRLEKLDSTTYGNNLLNVLSLTSSSNNLLSLAYTNNNTLPHKTTKTASINLQMMQYALNIANDTANHNEILATPSLIATHGKPSNFFSGNDLTLALTSTQGGGNLVSKEVGISLSLTPFFLEDNKIVLDVTAARTELVGDTLPGNLQNSTTPALQTVRSSVSATSILSPGESLVLSGINERVSLKTRDGVPILGDVPVASYFFSSENLQTTEISVLFIISPRFSEMIIRDEAGNWVAVPTEKEKSQGSIYLNILKSTYPKMFHTTGSKVFLKKLSSPYLSRNFRAIDMPIKHTSTPEISNLLSEVKQYF